MFTNIVLPPLLIITIGLIIAFRVRMRYSTKNYHGKMDDYIKVEEEANLIRKQEIDKKYFVVPNINKLPILDYECETELSACQNTVIKKSQLKMIHFDKQMSNLELKKIYGVNNLQKIINYEEHYNMYISALNKWAEELIKAEKISDAEKVLQEAVIFGSDYLMTYTLLIDIYIKQNQAYELNKLRNDILNDKFFENSTLKNRIINYISYRFGG